MDAGLDSDVDGEHMGVDPSHSDQQQNAQADEDWTSFRARVDREWRLRRARDSTESPLADPDDPAGYGPAEYSLTDFGDRLLSGPAAQLFGGSSGSDRAFSPFSSASPASANRPVPPGHPSYPSLPPVSDPGPVSGSLPAVGRAGPPSIPAFVPAPAPAESSGLVRPYFRTGGRTRPSQDLAVEALVSTSERGRALGRVRVPEHRTICSLCLDTRSVAEVAAYLRLPLGVVRVLIGDVAGLGLVLVHSATTVVGDRPSIDFMERVLSGLRRI